MSAFKIDIESMFAAHGGKFAIPINEIKAKQTKIKAFILDWDGVFNDGVKRDNNGSPFSEVDSMGLNMLRFSFYLKYGFIPAIFIVTGENNQPALQLSKREHFHGVYLQARDKKKALDHIGERFGFKSDEIAFIFDDILDLGVAEKVLLRYFVNRAANPLLNDFIDRNGMADYYTANNGANNAVREICELSLAMNDNYDEVLRQRIDFTSTYQAYLSERDGQPTAFFSFVGNRITDLENL